jgi:hypothetical protein
VEQLRDRFLGKDLPRIHLVEAFEKHNAQVRLKTRIDYTLSTWKKFNTCYKKLRQFVNVKRKRQDLLLAEVA